MIPMLGITGYSGSGKTTLLEKLVPQLIQRGLAVAILKHSHHNAQIDSPGKDTWRMKEAGARQVIMASEQRWALMMETPQKSASLDYLNQQFDHRLIDLILVEGFKQEPIHKILLHRKEMTKPLPEIDQYVIALATNYTLFTTVPLLDINNHQQMVNFICEWYQKNKQTVK